MKRELTPRICPDHTCAMACVPYPSQTMQKIKNLNNINFEHSVKKSPQSFISRCVNHQVSMPCQTNRSSEIEWQSRIDNEGRRRNVIDFRSLVVFVPTIIPSTTF